MIYIYMVVDRMGLSENLGNAIVQNRKFSGLNLLFGGLFHNFFRQTHIYHIKMALYPENLENLPIINPSYRHS